MNQISATIRANPATPPTTPPAIAPAFVDEEEESDVRLVSDAVGESGRGLVEGVVVGEGMEDDEESVSVSFPMFRNHILVRLPLNTPRSRAH